MIPLSQTPQRRHWTQANWYVAPSPAGSDSNNGTSPTTAFATIAHAASVASAGQIIEVLNGTYALSAGMFMDNTIAGTIGNPLTFRAASKWGAKITCNATSGTSNQAVWEVRGDYIIIDGFEIDASGSSSNSVWAVYIAGTGTIIQNCKVHDLLTDTTQWANNNATGGGLIGLDYFYGGSGQSALNNLVYNVGPPVDYGTSNLVHGIYSQASGCINKNNVVYNIAGDCITSFHHATNLIIVNNTCFNGKGGITIASSLTNDNSIVNNNLTFGCSAQGISEQPTTGTHNVYNNNQCYNNTGGNIVLLNGNTSSGTVTTNPNVVSTVTPDFHLQAGSPCLGTGTTSNAPSTDFDGSNRSTSAPSRGAYET